MLILSICFNTVSAQKAIVVSGGDISNASYSASYSIGQISQQTASTSDGVVNQGVQQPFEIFSQETLNINEFPNAKIEILVYPNPVISFVNLSISNLEIVGASYQLFDLQGKLLANAKIIGSETIIEMRNYPVSTYFLKVQDNNGSLIKTFKIIKN